VPAEDARREYLEALGVDVWALRGAAPDEGPEVVHAELESTDSGLTGWPELREQVAACTLCSLHKTRTQTVFGVGSESADWMIIGEAPGAEEDRRGEPFVGRAGKLLDEMLRAVGLERDAVFIANILKCRPPNNRDPAADEAASCRPYLDRQIALVAPKLILAVGRIAAQHLLQTDAPLGRLRGQKHYLNGGQLPVVVTYHPAYLLRSPTQKRKAWQDLCLARQIVDELAT
jgi:DNA polymerase